MSHFFLESDGDIYAACPLRKSQTPTKLLFVMSKAILCVKVWCKENKTSSYYDRHTRLVEKSCVAELTAGLADTWGASQ